MKKKVRRRRRVGGFGREPQGKAPTQSKGRRSGYDMGTKYMKYLIMTSIVSLATAIFLVWYFHQSDRIAQKVPTKSLDALHSGSHFASRERIKKPQSKQSIDARPEEVEKAIAYLKSLDSDSQTQEEKQTNLTLTDTGVQQNEVEIERKRLLREAAELGFDNSEQQAKLATAPIEVLRFAIPKYRKLLEEAQEQKPWLFE